MRRAVFYFAFAFVSSGQPSSQDAVANWFSVHVGDKWIYSHERRDDVGDAIYRDERFVGGKLRISHWETEETVTGSWTVPEGTLVGKRVRVTAGSPPPEYRANAPDGAYLIRGSCLYSSEVEWNPMNHKLTPGFRDELLAGHLSADFCFPLVAGKTWGAPHFMGWRAPAEAKDWQVAGVEVRDQSAPDRGNTFHVISAGPYLGAGMTGEIWFEKGVGIVRDEEIHHGTVGEERSRLVRFEPVSPRR
jgi:hypothetical protein